MKTEAFSALAFFLSGSGLVSLTQIKNGPQKMLIVLFSVTLFFVFLDIAVYSLKRKRNLKGEESAPFLEMKFTVPGIVIGISAAAFSPILSNISSIYFYKPCIPIELMSNIIVIAALLCAFGITIAAVIKLLKEI